jgi:hypothetical protein
MFTKRNPIQEAENEGRGPKDFVTAETSPLVYARVAGFLLLFVVIIAPFSQLYVPSTLIVPADATATANNIGIWPGCWRRCAHWGTSVFPLACDQRRKRPTLQRKGATATLVYAWLRWWGASFGASRPFIHPRS